MTRGEIDLDNAVRSIEAKRMKMGKAFSVPLSSAAISILRAQEAERGENAFVSAGRPASVEPDVDADVTQAPTR